MLVVLFHGMQRIQVLFLLSIVHTLSSAQNLVPNPGFEHYTHCPGNFSEGPGEFQATGWFGANAGTPDYFNSCSRGDAGVPYNWAGVAEAHDGLGYAGIYL